MGRNNKFNGLFALLVVCSIVLGCQCNKILDAAKKNSGSDNPPTRNGDTKTPGNNPFANNTADDDKNGNEPPTYTKADASKKEIPTDAEMQDIVKNTLMDFNDALQDADFTEFYGKISKAWQKQTDPAKLKQGFKTFIDGRTDLTEIKPMKATFTTQPEIIKKIGYDMLNVKGEYPTPGLKTTFELQYVPEGKDWKLALIRVYAKIKK